MSDVMRPMGYDHLMNWILTEYKKSGRIFGVSKMAKHSNGQALPIFKEKIEAPFGPAAGPNTQLAQNIIASYAGGARFFELKTVQIMDGEELSKCVAKPCILAADECYNCEWSTELTVPQAFAEYVKAYFAIKLIAKEFGLGDPDAFVFNMSVGYDLAGIKSEKIDTYIEGMKNAEGSEVWKECVDWTLANLDCFENVDEAFVRSISPRISDSITESTLHGCPPDEIERIATYLITEKDLNTYIKCNPTLLGYEYARTRLDSLGFDYIVFDEHHFVEDLQWADAIPMFRRLIDLCREKGLEFGLKLTNTFPVDVTRNELPSEEMYMAGRSLFPLTIGLARKITDEFGGALRISYSGGADYDNIKDLFDAGIWPVTMATTVLKPGGYDRFAQIGDLLMDCGSDAFAGVSVEKVRALDDGVASAAKYKKPVKPIPDRKIGKKLPLVDCFTTPCRNGCPIEQDIPAYLLAVNNGDHEKALKIILERNALPFITGTLCPHTCGDKCMRNYYESTVRIREMKKTAAVNGFDKVLPELKADAASSDRKVAVVGGGPAGLATASFLSRAGVAVTVFEKSDVLGGVVRKVIPGFRITDEEIEKDIALCKAYGAEFVTGREVKSADELKSEGFTDVVFAIGAWKESDARLEYGETEDALDFLAKCKADPDSLDLGTDVCVIGGGNTAMDVARAAKRVPGVENVYLVYRRTRRYMPADEEELVMALEDGVEFCELFAPVGVKDGFLHCEVMELGEPDESGRRSPVGTGQFRDFKADTVIAAIGERIDTAIYEVSGIALDDRKRPILDENMMTSVEGVYLAGDGSRGPATVVKAIADAQKVATAIAGVDFGKYTDENIAKDPEMIRYRHGSLAKDIDPSNDFRCLSCQTVCETCMEVCPNRANVAITVPGIRQNQILHVDGMCNECGNCAVFCPYEGRPYKDKFTLFWSKEDFDNSENEGFLVQSCGKWLVRYDGTLLTVDPQSGCQALPVELLAMMETVCTNYKYLLGAQ